MVQEMNWSNFWNDKDGGGYGGFSEFDNSLFQSSEETFTKTFRNSADSEPNSKVFNQVRNSEKTVSKKTFRNWEETVSKRIRLSSPQEVDAKSREEKWSPLGLTLSKTPSFMNLVEMKLSKARQTTTNYPTNLEDFVSHHQPASEKLKASNFRASSLKIGCWERNSRHEGDLVAKCYYTKRKFVWEILEGALKSKIEIQWSDIAGIRATILENKPGILEIELNQPPLFFQEINPQPRKHTLWHQASDFTGGQAPICRRHNAVFPPGVLDKHYEKLLQCDPRLLVLSQKSFPGEKSPYFHRNTHVPTQFSFDFTRCGLEFSPRYEYLVPDVLIPVLPPHHHVQNINTTRRSPLVIMDSNSPLSVMDFSRIDEKGNNYSFRNERTTLSGQGQNIIGDKFVVEDHVQDNQLLHCLDYHAMKYGEEVTRSNLNPGILCDIEDHLLGDSQLLCSDERALLAIVISGGSFLETAKEVNSSSYCGMNIQHLEANHSNNCNGMNIQHLEANPSNNYNVVNIQHLEANTGNNYSSMNIQHLEENPSNNYSGMNIQHMEANPRNYSGTNIQHSGMNGLCEASFLVSTSRFP